MPVSQIKRPLQNAFALELQGFDNSTWKSVNGLEMNLEVVDDPNVDGRAAWSIYRYPGQVSYADLTLTRGFGSMELYKWFEDVVTKGKIDDRRHGSVTAYAGDMKTQMARWDFTHAWPLSISSSDVSTKSSELMIETLTLVIETLTRVK